MRLNLKRFKSILLLELDTNYSFPLLEIIVSLLVVLSFYFMAGGAFYAFFGIPHLVQSGPEIIVFFEEWTRTHAIRTLQGASYDISFILAFFIPVLTALTFGRDMDTGTFRTFLSYPISRHQLFLAKEFLILVVISGTTSISYFVALLSFEPNLNSPGLILLFLVTQWTPAILVSLATILIAVLSKSLSASLFGGVALSFGMMISPFLFRSMDTLLVAILNPVMAVSTYIFEDYSISILQSLSVGIVASLAISVLLLIVTLKQINRMEV
ncbi:MAG: hypothetical protein KGD60_10740 [Candidatus Thorarchaeota archaeon]|nr:hypothetical protein [Candidatus Thorarchaeota archaeon]